MQRLPRDPLAPVDQAVKDQEERRLPERMQQVGYKLIVLSGKGGVGKSTVAANLAVALAGQGLRVGLLDVDIHGPSIPRLMGLEGRPLGADGGQILPVEVNERLAVMSIGFLLGDRADAVIWRGPLKFNIIRQFLSEVAWGMLDYLVIDSPPGTGDEPLSVAQLVGRPAGALMVTTPQELSVADVRRCVTFCEKASLPVIGILENMSGFVCPHCGHGVDLFGRGGGEELAREMKVPFLGRIPIDPEVVSSGDDGRPFVESRDQGPAAQAFTDIVGLIAGADRRQPLPPGRQEEAPGRCP